MSVFKNKMRCRIMSIILIAIFALIGFNSLSIEANNIKAIEKKQTKANVENEESLHVDVWTQEKIDQSFIDMADTDLILDVPNGGFIFCAPEYASQHFTAIDENGNVVEDYVLATDPNTMTVKEMKQYLLGKPIEYE